MGSVLAERLLRSGHDVAVYNRTPAKTEPLEALGAAAVEAPSDLADRSIVFTMIGGDADLLAVIDGPSGLLTGSHGPGLLIDCSTVSSDVSVQVRHRAKEIGTPMLAAPVSGNPKVANAGMLSLVVSGPRESFESPFTRYKTPALVNLDFHPTFTGHLLRKDLELGLEAGRDLAVPLPITAAAHEIVTALVDGGHGDEDFAALLVLEAARAGLELEPERVDVDDGLHPVDDLARAARRDA